ncbi:MAG: TonB-dependent receptor [Hyphomonas sp.]|tara:strand:+ start:9690 stop:12824 length:3135 start_codon:yes stop_codon:yes gene_type:complete
MMNWNTFGRGMAVSAIALSVAGLAAAQVTTSSIRGQVTNSDGAAVSGATVTILHVPTGTVAVTTTTATGAFGAQNLRVGGPYSVTVTGPGFVPSRADDIYANLGDATSLDLVVESASDDTARMETVVITGSAVSAAQVASGPSSTYNLSTLENAPAMNRDIKDIVRLDPRVYVDEAFNDSISCAGANPRYNSLTVDGARLNDNFGLNSNGYPTERIPFSYDSIEQVSVELAPFDVEYGQFTACNINAVTKSGSNEFHGGAFYDYTSDGFTGDKVDGTDVDLGDFEEKRYGFNVGGPIIKDKLFFFGSYEKFEGASIFGFTPESAGITQADYDQIIGIAEGYGYIAGGLPTSIPVEDEKIFAKLDWNITNNHRAILTYNYNDGFNFSPSDDGSSRLSDGNHYYERGAKLQNYTGALYSDWTENLSTEFRVTYVDLENRQIPVGGLDNFGEVQVRVGGSTVYLGADDSRHANELTYETLNFKGKVDYTMGDHLFTFGAEREEFEVFNLFIQEVQGEWVFNSIADFAAGQFSDYRYENAAGTNNQDDGAAAFAYAINTFYAQDEWQVTDKLNIVAGLRYDTYQSDDAPAFNQTFLTNYGVRNDETMDGRDLLQPRFGFKYEFSDNVEFHGGAGLYSGGNPNVWIANNYSNNGVTLFESRVRGGNIADFTYAGGTGSPFIDVADESIAAVAAAAGGGPVNAIDPNFEIPSEWKFALGTVIDYDSPNPVIGSDWRIMADILYSKTNEAALSQPISWIQTDTAPDGRPIYGLGNTNDFLLTNAKEKGSALVLSLGVSKQYDNGMDWSLGYAYTDAKDANPMTSSVAFSNFINFATDDAYQPDLGTSDYEIAHRFTFQFNYEKDFINNLTTRASLFGTASEGAPYSYTLASSTGLFSPTFGNQRALAYIPQGLNDTNISPLSDPATVAALNQFVNENEELWDYRGGVIERGSAADDWWTKFDLRLSQELPGFRENDRTEAFVVIENLGNLLNNEWGVLREHGFPGNAELYSVDSIVNGQYVISGFNADADRDRIVNSASLWQVHFGVKYKF